ncbi:MAG: hypothetical protein KDB27_16085 [Planctomycetales bacterium]|nr:hypothetical protein [Planctomycetales bacterium]
MTPEEFQRVVLADPQLAEPIQAAAESGRSKQFGVLTEAAVIALMFPVAKHVLTSFALPWMQEAKRYSELQRQKVHEWINARYRYEGFDPEQAEAASDALLERLESTTDQSARTTWERLADLFAKSEDAADGD